MDIYEAFYREGQLKFGFSGGERADVVSRKRSHMANAQNHWPFLTSFDASTIKTDQQLTTMVKERCAMSQEEAEKRCAGMDERQGLLIRGEKSKIEHALLTKGRHHMEYSYWLGRKRTSLANARAATGAVARLIHYELAGRYSVKAANSPEHRLLGVTG